MNVLSWTLFAKLIRKMHKVVIVCPPISKYCYLGEVVEARLLKLTFECQSQWIGLGWRRAKGDRVGLWIRLFRKQYSKTFASHTPASHSRCTCFFLDTVEWRRAADVFRVDEPDSGISGALSFNFTLIVIWKQSNSHLSCCRESSEEACHLHGISLI